MQTIYELVRESPEFYTWLFSIVTTLSVVFTYFNKKTHDKELKALEQNLRFDADRRLRIFDLKATEYSRYVTHLDEFGKKNHTELIAKMQPIVDQYMTSYLKAAGAGDKDGEISAITLFGSQISSITQDGIKEVMQLRHESNRIKLIATQEMLSTLEALESLTDRAFKHSTEFMNNFVKVVSESRQDLVASYQEEALALGLQIKSNTDKLMDQMRREIGAI